MLDIIYAYLAKTEFMTQKKKITQLSFPCRNLHPSFPD